MNKAPFSCSKYSYHHHGGEGPLQAIDVHEIMVKRNRIRVFLSYFGMILFLTSTVYNLLMQELSAGSFWIITSGFILAKILQYKPVKKESVVIMQAFGVQLETHYWSGSAVRRFIPINTILKPVLNECVTPVTCYWSLALILREKEELVLVFERLQPPVEILVRVWKALHATTDCSSDNKF